MFYDSGRNLRAYVHGDEFVIVGQLAALQWMRESMEKKYELTVETLGPDEGQVKEVRVFNGVLRWTNTSNEHKAGPRHVKLILCRSSAFVLRELFRVVRFVEVIS